MFKFKQNHLDQTKTTAQESKKSKEGKYGIL